MKKMIVVNFLLALSFTMTASNLVYAQDTYNSDTSAAQPQSDQMQDQTQPSEVTTTQPQEVTTTETTVAQPQTTNVITSDEVNLRMAMRQLWEDHIIYTRNYIISALANLQDADAVSKRLLKNQDDIGNAIKPYYGEDAGNKLAKLLRDHIMIATKVVKAAKSHNAKALKDSQQQWTANADDIAAFLSSANTNWSKDDLQSMLHTHLDLTAGEVSSRLKKDWNADIDFFDKGQDHMLKFSDTLTDGIIKQFPQKFNKA